MSKRVRISFLALVAFATTAMAQDAIKPVADLLDVQFQEDGTVVDASPQNRTVQKFGDGAEVYYNQTFKRYVAKFNNDWAGATTGFYKVDYDSDEAYRAALADGHTLECLVMPSFEGALPNRECKPFSAMQAGGTGFLVCAQSGARQNEFTFLPNVSTTGGSNWIWTTSGIVPKSQFYYHLVGVWDKEAQEAKIYVNGQLLNTMLAVGDMHFANGGCNWFCIGSDPNGVETCDACAWRGDIVLARAYNKPLSEEEVGLLWADVESPCREALTASFNQILEEGMQYAAEVVATQSLIDSYKAALTELGQMLSQSGTAELEAQANTITALRRELEASASAYQVYYNKVEAAKAFLEEHNVQGAARNELQAYLSDTYPTVWGEHQKSSEDIQAEIDKVKDLLAALETLVATIPVADLLDIEFMSDGTAKDVSPMHKTVENYGDTYEIYYNAAFQRYVAKFNNPWAGNASGFFKVDYEEDETFRNALADGHTLECLVMPNYEGAIPNAECKPFSAMQSGGTGFLISTISGARQNWMTFLPNVSTNGGSNWIWTTSGVTPANHFYYHVIGVWDKEAQEAKVYINGELCNTVSAPGDFHFASSGCNWLCVGADPSSAGAANAAWNGDIVLARAYDKPLNAAEVSLLWDAVHSGQTEANLQNYVAQLNEGIEYVQDEKLATQALLDAYRKGLEDLQGLIDSENFEALDAAATDLKVLRAQLETSVAAYQQYITQAEDAKAYLDEHDDFAGEDRDMLEDYLSSFEEPGETFGNGSYEYIRASHTLSTEEITAETQKVATMLSTAIENGFIPGADITKLLTNSDFADGLNGWSGNTMSSSVKSNTCELYGAEAWAKNFDMFQTLQGLDNGVYVLTANATYRPFNDQYSTYYSASMYLNDMNLFLPTAYETRISVDEAEDGENCYLTATNPDDSTVDLEVCDEFGDVIGYAIHGRTGMANAANAGRAQNCLVTKVTDGTLKVGFQSSNKKATSDWTGVANIHLFYLGESLADAEHYLDEALSCYIERANTIIAIEPSTGIDFAENPNCPKVIKDQLQEAVNAVASANSVEQKYELQNTFTELFALFLEGRAAYVKLIDELEYLNGIAGEKYDAELISSEEYDAFNELYLSVYEKYETGAYSTQEALAMEELKNSNLLGEFIEPTADLLDVVFLEDGNAKDISPMHNDVLRVGDKSSTYYSSTYKRYVASFDNPWSSTGQSHYRVDFENNEAFRNALADGHSLEILVMPNYEGTIANVECKPFSAMQAGGTGFLVTTKSGARQNELTFLPNVSTSGGSNWIWTTSGVVPQSKAFYHVIGVWDKEAKKSFVYVNGDLCNTVTAEGELHFANAGCNWFCIGGDPSGANSMEASWRGDIALVRVYDKPLDRRQASYLFEHIYDGEDAIERISKEQIVPAAKNGIFTINGIRVEKTQQGLYIINGKTILVK